MPNQKFDFYSTENNEYNTWNYNLDFMSTTKKNIMNESSKFGFGNYNYSINDKKILVKGIDHTIVNDPNYNPKIVDREVYEKNYDKNKFIGQRILMTENKINQELNIYVVRDLDTRELQVFCVLCFNDTSFNINRKKSKCNFEEVSIEILDDKKESFFKYMDSINLDYGRIELIKDKLLGWCVIDINNSPGGGPLTNKYYSHIVKMFKNICI